jgi:CheY-like chemotaxis protein
MAACILLVEDNDLNRDMLTRRLVRRGYHVEIAVDGRQGLQMASTSSPDLILLDLSLPEMDGYEVLRNLKLDPIMKSIPVIALTAHALVSDRDRAIEAGFNDYDIKPIEMQRLLNKMELLIKQKPGVRSQEPE